MTILALLASTFLTTAEAASCGSYVNQAASQQGAGLVRTFAKLAKCDKTMAEDNFLGAFVPRATDVDTMVQLTETAITAGVFQYYSYLERSRANRNGIASGLCRCATNPQVVKFLQSHFMLNNTDFVSWDDAYETCESTDIDMVQTQIMGRPTVHSMALAEIYQEKIVDSFAVLQAIKSIETEYFDTIIVQMNNAVQPGLGETMSEDSRAAFENAILAIAAKAPSKA